MSPTPNDIQALESAIVEEAAADAGQILADVQAQAESLHQEAQAQIDAAQAAILQRAQAEARVLYEHTVAAAQLEAQTLKLQRREQLLERVFAAARQRLASVREWPDYDQIAQRLVREAVERLGADEVLVWADENTRKVLSDEALADLGKEPGVRLQAGKTLAQSTGVVLETPDGHRRYDNTLETRLARMQEALRTPVYRILMGETP